MSYNTMINSKSVLIHLAADSVRRELAAVFGVPLHQNLAEDGHGGRDQIGDTLFTGLNVFSSWAPVTLQEGDDLGILLGGADDLSYPGDGSTALVTSGCGKEGPDVLGAGAQPFADVLGVQELKTLRPVNRVSPI